MAVTPEIKTRFTLDGLRQAATGLRGFGRTVADTLGDARRRGGIVFDPMSKGLTAVERKTKTVAKELTKIGASNAFRGIRLGALGASVAVGGLATKMSAVSAAALKAAKDSAASLRGIAIDAQRIGGNASDVAVLGYAADVTGTDRDEIITQVSTLSNEFLTLRENINDAYDSYSDFLNSTAQQAGLAYNLAGNKGFQQILDGYSNDELEARKASILDAEARLAELDAMANTYRARSGVVYAGDDLRASANRVSEEYERRELAKAIKEFKAGQSAQGQGLYELMDYGLDFDRATAGGVEGLLALSEAFKRVENPSQKARIAMRLFGEDAGVKLIPLLNGGREEIEKYTKTLKESGGIASEDDIANANRYTLSVLNLKNAYSGLQMTVGRALWPDLTKTADELTEHIIKGRNEIAKHAVEAFKNTRIFAEDAAAIIGGDTGNIQTAWLDTAVKKTITLRDIWRDVRKQISLLWNGKDSDYKWLNAIRDGLVSVKKFAQDAWKQIALISSGKASDYEWLNDLVSGVQWFTTHLSAAFEMFKTTLGYIKDAVKPILDFVGTDFTTSAMFIGILRLTGLLGGLKLAAGLAAGAVGKIGAAGVGLAGAVVSRPGAGAAPGAIATAAGSGAPAIAAAIASGGDTLADKIRRAWTAETTVGAISGSVAQGVRSGASSIASTPGAISNGIRTGASAIQGGAVTVRDGFRDRWAAAREEVERRRANPGPGLKERFAEAAAGARQMRDTVVSATADAVKATAALPGQAAAATAEGFKTASKAISDTAEAAKAASIAAGNAARASAISTATATRDAVVSSIKATSDATMSAVASARLQAVAFPSLVKTASGAAASSVKDSLVTSLTMARLAAVDGGKATVQSFKASGAAAVEFATATGSRLKSLATDTDAWRGRITGVGTSFKSVGTSMIGSIGALKLSLGGVIESLLVLGTTAVTAFEIGQQAAKWWFQDTMKAYDAVIEGQAALMRANDDVYIKGMLNRRDEASRGFRDRYWKEQGILQGGWRGMSAAERAAAAQQKMDDFIGWKRADGIDGTESHRASDARRAAQQPPAAVFRYDIKVNNGRQVTGMGDMNIKRALDELNNGFS